MESVLSRELPKRYYIYGETGTGKSLFTRMLSAQMKTPIYKKSCSGYWNGYKGEKLVVIDDMTRDDWKYIKFNLKKWLDYDTFISSPLRDRMSKEEIKEGEEIDPSKYTLVITSYKSLEEFLNEERTHVGEDKALSDREISKIKRLLEVYEMQHTDLKEIEEDIKKILN